MNEDENSTSDIIQLRVKTMDSKEHQVEVIANGKVNDLKISIEQVRFSDYHKFRNLKYLQIDSD